MRSKLFVLLLVLAAFNVLSACQQNHKTLTSPSPRAILLSPTSETPAEAGHIHNEVLRQIEASIALASTTKVQDTLFCSLMSEATKLATGNEPGDGVFWALLDTAKALKGSEVVDLFGPEKHDATEFFDYLLEREKITQTEYNELTLTCEDTDWELSSTGLQTELAKAALAVRDSSRAFWISRECLDSGTECTPTVGFFAEQESENAGIVVSDLCGYILGSVMGAGTYLGAGVSLLYIAVVEAPDDTWDDYYPCQRPPMN